MKKQAVENKYGCGLVSVDYKNVKLQLPDKEIVIGESTKKHVMN